MMKYNFIFLSISVALVSIYLWFAGLTDESLVFSILAVFPSLFSTIASHFIIAQSKINQHKLLDKKIDTFLKKNDPNLYISRKVYRHRPTWLRFITLVVIIYVSFSVSYKVPLDIENADFMYWTYIFLYMTFFTIVNMMFFIELKGWLLKSNIKADLLKEFSIVFIAGISNIFIFAALYNWHGIQSSTGIVKGDIIASIYFSAVTWTTLGYSDLSPPPSLRLIVSFEAFLGYLYMALLVGFLLNTIQVYKTRL